MDITEYENYQDAKHLAYSEADFDGYQAAPLLLFGTGARKEVVARQDKLAENFTGAIKAELAPPLVKSKIAEYVASCVVARMHQREGLNGVSYMHRLNEYPRYDEVDLESPAFINKAIKLAKYGGSTVYQNRIARQALGMATIELANHTVVGEFRKDDETRMWNDIGALVGKDATPQYDDMYRIRVLGFSPRPKDSPHIGAMRIGMKRIIDQSADGTLVKARTTAIVNTSPNSGFDQSVVEEFRDLKFNLEELSKLESFKRAVKWLVQSEVPPYLVLAKNETVYEEHLPTRDEVARRHGFGVYYNFKTEGRHASLEADEQLELHRSE